VSKARYRNIRLLLTDEDLALLPRLPAEAPSLWKRLLRRGARFVRRLLHYFFAKRKTT